MAENIACIDDFASQNTVLDCDIKVAKYYGNVKNLLKQKGRPIPENDIWIAAVALYKNLILVSRDAHFKEVEDVQVETW